MFESAFEQVYLFVQSVIAEVSYTQTQLLGKALDKVKTAGLFITAVVAWNDPNDANKT